MARYGVFLFFLLFVILSMTIFRKDITFDNFRYLMKYLEISPPSVGEEENILNIAVGKDATIGLINDKLVLAEDHSVVSYDLSGRKLLSETVRYQNPTAVQNAQSLLLYDRDGTGLSIYNSFSKVYDKNLPTAIEAVTLSDDGGFAVITREKSYSGGFTVYDNHYKKIYSFMTRTATVTDLCYDGKQKRAACATLDAKDGDFYAELYTFDLTNENEIKASASLTGEMPLSMFCVGDGFALMTDRGLHFYDYDAKETAFCDFEYETPSSLYRFDEFFAVVFKSSLAGTETALRIYDDTGSLLYTQYFKSEPADVHAANGFFYVLEPYTLNILSYDENGFSTRDTIPTDGEYKAVFSLDEEQYLLISSSSVIRRSIAPVETESETESETIPEEKTEK